MTTSFIKYSLLALLPILLSASLFAQNGVEWQPELSFTWQPHSRWQLNLKAVSYHESGAGSPREAFSTRHLEWALMGTYRLLSGASLSLGYAFRVREPFDPASNIENRLTWQYVAASRIEKYRLGHRLRAEQRFRNTGLIHRWRYRFSLDFPLDGERLDPGEPYAKASEELLWSIQSGAAPEVENRMGGGLGWYFGTRSKIELLAEYRLSDLNLADPAHRMVVFGVYYFNL